MISMETSSFLCLLHRHTNAIEAASATFDHNSQQHIKLWRDCGATTTAIEANQPLHLTAILDNITNRDPRFNKCSQPHDLGHSIKVSTLHKPQCNRNWGCIGRIWPQLSRTAKILRNIKDRDRSRYLKPWL
jgi:hypothetical protein